MRAGRGIDAGDDPGHGSVADGVEARLDAGLGARQQVRGDGLLVEVPHAVRRCVRVRRVQQRGAAAERTVDEEVARQAVGARALDDRARVLRVAGRLAPVAAHVDPVSEGAEEREVALARDVGTAALVHGGDAGGGRGVEGRGLGGGDLRVGERREGRRADGVVGGGGERTVGRETGEALQARDERPQGGAGLRGVLVDAGRVDEAVLVEVGALERTLPVGVVPAPGDDGGAGGGGERGLQRLRAAREVGAGEREPRRGEVHMGVDERRGDEHPVEVGDGQVRVQGARGVVLADPGHDTVLMGEGGG